MVKRNAWYKNLLIHPFLGLQLDCETFEFRVNGYNPWVALICVKSATAATLRQSRC
jgi:hypothetical protein